MEQPNCVEGTPFIGTDQCSRPVVHAEVCGDLLRRAEVPLIVVLVVRADALNLRLELVVEEEVGPAGDVATSPDRDPRDRRQARKVDVLVEVEALLHEQHSDGRVWHLRPVDDRADLVVGIKVAVIPMLASPRNHEVLPQVKIPRAVHVRQDPELVHEGAAADVFAVGVKVYLPRKEAGLRLCGDLLAELLVEWHLAAQGAVCTGGLDKGALPLAAERGGSGLGKSKSNCPVPGGLLVKTDNRQVIFVSCPLGAREDWVPIEVAEGELLVDETGELLARDKCVRLGLGSSHVAADLVVQLIVPGLCAGGKPVALLIDCDQARLGGDWAAIASDIDCRGIDQVDAVPLILLVPAVWFGVAYLQKLQADHSVVQQDSVLKSTDRALCHYILKCIYWLNSIYTPEVELCKTKLPALS